MVNVNAQQVGFCVAVVVSIHSQHYLIVGLVVIIAQIIYQDPSTTWLALMENANVLHLSKSVPVEIADILLVQHSKMIHSNAGLVVINVV